MMNDVVDTHVRLQKAIQTIAEQKRHIVKCTHPAPHSSIPITSDEADLTFYFVGDTVFAEIQNQKDARTRLEGEYKEQGEKLQAMNAVSPSESFVLHFFSFFTLFRPFFAESVVDG